ncbi:peptidylprolyl isomerase [Planctomicrobium sp. SH668]|uniref:peptidylprolyl isomerase n=1 Tax=Planctomicrobium sp. SH668 TaxID=3448126 RepID=UPI003F5C3797
MSRKYIMIMILLTWGCGTKNYQVANPVLGPPPPRVQNAAELQSKEDRSTLGLVKSASASSDIRTVSHEAVTPLADSDVVAYINGRPVLAGEILERYGGGFQKQKDMLKVGITQRKISEEDAQKVIRNTQEKLIRQDLDALIDTTLMADAVRSKLKKEQLEKINEQIAVYFEKERVSQLKADLNVATTLELEGMLQEQGTSLETLRKAYGDQQLASQYLHTKMGEDPRPNRAEIIAVYESQREKYERPLQVKWQQLQINIKPSNKSDANAKMEAAQADLRAGASFDEVVKKYSDGPMKSNGGHWDFTKPDSIANIDVREAVSKLKPGQISPVIVSNTSLQVIKVIDRKEQGFQPLEEVQEDIRQQIIGEFRKRRTTEVLREVREKAVIETMFGDDYQPGKGVENL